MKPPFILVAIFFSFAAALAADRSKPVLSEFDGIDANRDGRISADEHAAAAKKMFQAIDADRDGKVTAAEMDAAYERVSGKKAAESDVTAKGKIEVVDPSGDRILTSAEHAGAARAMFSWMDTDRDGYLSRDEWTAGNAALMQSAAR
jgi:Ca2+-binding EF-hand superfamily protein